MIRAQQIIDRLKEDGAGGLLKHVGGAGTLPVAADQLKANPSAFVMPLGERALTNDAGTGITNNPTDIFIKVLLGFTGINASFRDQTDFIEKVIAGVKVSLIGWTPDSNIYRPINPVSVGYEFGEVDKGVLFMGANFSSHYWQRK